MSPNFLYFLIPMATALELVSPMAKESVMVMAMMTAMALAHHMLYKV